MRHHADKPPNWYLKIAVGTLFCPCNYMLCCNGPTTTVQAGLLCASASGAHVVENEADFVDGPKLLGPLRHLPARPFAVCEHRHKRRRAAWLTYHSLDPSGTSPQQNTWHQSFLLPANSTGSQQRTHPSPTHFLPGLERDPIGNALPLFKAQSFSGHSRFGAPVHVAKPHIPHIQLEPDQAARLWMSPRRTALTMPNRPYLGPGRSRSACDRRAISA